MSYLTNAEVADLSHAQRSKLRRYWLRNYVDNLGLIKKGAKTFTDLPDLGFGKPVAVIGGAPIRPECFEMLKGVGCLTTICCDKALPLVLPYYRPQYVCALNTMKTDRVELEKWFADTEGMSLIVPLTVHPDTVKVFSEAQMLRKGDIYWVNPTNIDDDLVLRFEQETGIRRYHRGLNVGEFALSMAAFLRPAEIALFGMWYAFRERESLNIPDPMNYAVAEYVEEGERWWTYLTWLSARTGLTELMKGFYSQNIDICNCSEGGILYHPEYCPRTAPEDFVERWKEE